MRITKALLRRHKACASQVELFERTFPKGVTLTKEICLEHAHTGFNLTWAVEHLFPPEAPYHEAITPAWRSYKEARESARRAYEETMTRARGAYEEARASAGRAYEETMAPAWYAYEEAVAFAFWKAVEECKL